MNMGRLLCAVIVFAVCTIFGSVRNSGRSKCLYELGDMIADMEELETAMRLEHMPLQSIAQRLAVSGKCEWLWEGVCEGMRNGASFGTAYHLIKKPYLGAEIEKSLNELASRLGTSDLETEIKRIRKTTDELTRVYSEMQRKNGEKSKLVNSLSILTGLAAALLVM